MPNTAQVKFNEVDLTQQVAEIDKGIVAISVATKRGPFGHDGEVISSWEAWKAKYGGESIGLPGATLVKRMFQYGARVRTNRMGHYTDASDRSTLDAVLGSISGGDFANNDDVAPVQMFNLILKYKGADYNNLTIYIDPASNGDDTYFNLAIEHNLEPGLNELYENLKVPGILTVAEQQDNPDNQWLKQIANQSKLVIPVYTDLSSATAPNLRPLDDQWDVAGGDDGTAPDDTDYSGDSAGETGFFAFDSKDDFTHIAALDNYSATVMQAGAAYVENREDCVLVASLDYSVSNTSAALQTAKAALNVDSKYVYFVTAGININDAVTSTQKDFHEIGDVLGIAAKSESEFGPWYSFAGHNRGVLQNVNGVVNNFGTKGKLSELNDLARKQINCVINRKGKVMVWGNFSGQLETSVKSFIANVKLGIFIKKSLEPVLEAFLEEPNDIATWRRIYDVVKPFFDDLASDSKRALDSWEWNGDQFAPDLDSLQINRKSDVLAGKYKVQLVIVEKVSLQEFTLNIISSIDTGVEFNF